jgi:hypothetical protein
VSKGPWKSKSRERRESEEVVALKIEPWKDTRVEARAKAKEQTDAARREAIAALAHRNRQEAKERGAKRYLGMPCERHVNAERYTSTGNCVFCVAERTAARRGKPCIYGMLRGNRLPPLLRHMPSSRHSGKLGGATPVLLLDIEDHERG